MWDLDTSRLDVGQCGGKTELSATSILTVPSLTMMKRILDVADRVFPWYNHTIGNKEKQEGANAVSDTEAS